MDVEEAKSFSAMAEETSKTDEILTNQLGDFFCDAVRDPAAIFSHKYACFAQPGSHCNCSFATMNFTEWSALDAAC